MTQRPPPTVSESWPDELNRLYDLWLDRLRPHRAAELSKASGRHKDVLEMCNRLSFMYGVPFHEKNLVPEIHAHEQPRTAELPKQFGIIPLHMFVHGAQNVRRQTAGYYQAEEAENGASIVGPEALRNF